VIRLRRGKDENSPLWIWEFPDPDCKYYIGADAARGKEDGDFSAAIGWNGHTGEQAFTWSGRCSVDHFAWTLNALGLYYNKAMMYPEQTGGDGAHVLKLLRDSYHYPTWAPWKGRDDKLHAKPSMTIGWETTWKSRQRLLVMFRTNISTGFLKPRDSRMVAQMALMIRDDLDMHWEVTKGHDDIIMAAMIGAMAIDQWPPPKLNHRTTNLMVRGTENQVSLPFETEPSFRLREKYQLVTGLAKDRVGDPLQGI
jgi:hypothetical protein